MGIPELFDQFVKALERNDMSLLDDVLASDVVIRSSHLGDIHGLDDAKKALAWRGLPITLANIRVFNNVVREAEDVAHQRAYLVMLFGSEVDGFLHHFQCGFHTTVAYARESGAWKVSEVRMNMAYETGNTLLVANWWKLMDHDQFEGNNLHLIDKNDQSPWVLVPETQEPLSGEETIRQAFLHYAWLMDTYDIPGVAAVTTENGYPADRYASRDDWLRTLTTKRLTEACWSHIVSIEAIEVGESSAHLTALRYEPHRIGNEILHKSNIDTVFYTAAYTIGFVMTPHGWLIDSFGHRKESVAVHGSAGQRYF
ncbi:MAG: nuclear transport factor 2 family protein [Actinomycetota bacterium]